MNNIPTYALYGEVTCPVWSETVNVEPIRTRSSGHNWYIVPHQHDMLLQALYMQNGSGQMQFDSQSVFVTAPCIIYLPARSVHGFAWNGPVDGITVTALQPPVEAMIEGMSSELAQWMQIPHTFNLPYWSADQDPLLPLLSVLQKEYANRGTEHTTCILALVVSLLVKLLRLDQSDRVSQGEADPPRLQLLRLFRDKVEEQFRQHVSVVYYANQLGMSPITLARLCQEHLGMTPLAVINARLMLEARRELAYTTRPIKQVAYELGFSEKGYFSRFFRKQAGISPSEFRELTLMKMSHT